jgi:UDP-N-acetylmuramyl tripeptide synthase
MSKIVKVTGQVSDFIVVFPDNISGVDFERRLTEIGNGPITKGEIIACADAADAANAVHELKRVVKRDEVHPDTRAALRELGRELGVDVEI